MNFFTSKSLKRLVLGMTTPLMLFSGKAMASALTFGEKAVNQENFVVVATPLSRDWYKVNVLEQISDQRRCWEESGQAPTQIDPLLLTFDFTNDCRRYDRNAYSVYGLGEESRYYRLRIRAQQTLDDTDASGPNEIVLEAWKPFNRNEPAIEIGRADVTEESQHVKIELDPNWSLTQKVIDGEPINHIQFSRTSETATP